MKDSKNNRVNNSGDYENDELNYEDFDQQAQEYAEEEYYEDAADEEYYDEEYYDEEVYEDEEYEEEYYGEEEPASVHRRLESNSSGGVIQKILLAMAAGVAVLLAITVGALVFIKNSGPTTAVSDNGLVVHTELAGAGIPLNGITTIGGNGLLAALDAKKAENAALLAEGLALSDVDGLYLEGEYNTEIAVGVETVSVLKDLKIKFINTNTGKLIANVPFEVLITTPSGDSKTVTDSDKDGIIYMENIEAGTYKLKIVALSDSKYEAYAYSADLTADVRATLAYEKVKVADEILDPSKVDESAEDTAREGADSGSTLTNTVTKVDSSVVENYVPIDKSLLNIGVEYAVSNDTVIAALDGGIPYLVRTVDEPTLKPMVAAVNVNKGSSNNVDIDVRGGVTFSVTSSDASIATASVAADSNIVTITGVSVGTTTVVLTQTNAADGATPLTASIAVTVVDKPCLTVSKTTATMLPGVYIKYGLNLTNMTKSDLVVSNTSDEVATFAVNDAGTEVTITALTVGTTTFTMTNKNDSTVAPATITVTVVANSEKITYKLDGVDVKVYVKDGSAYREATYADYAKAQTDASVGFYYLESKYTGWQTIDGKKYYYTSEGKRVTGEQVIDGMLYNFDSTGALVTGGGILGIDVSKWNGTIDWDKVKSAGVSYVIIRVGYRGSTQGGLIDDANFKKNIEGATKAGLKVGVYFVTQAINETEAIYEASMVLDRIAPYTISYPIFLDVEASGGRGDKIDKATRTAVCKAFCKTIANAGYTAGVYANKSWLTDKIDASALSEYKIWVAQYYTSCTYSGTYAMWQYSEKGTISGISGNVDLNYSYLGY